MTQTLHRPSAHTAIEHSEYTGGGLYESKNHITGYTDWAKLLRATIQSGPTTAHNYHDPHHQFLQQVPTLIDVLGSDNAIPDEDERGDFLDYCSDQLNRHGYLDLDPDIYRETTDPMPESLRQPGALIDYIRDWKTLTYKALLLADTRRKTNVTTAQTDTELERLAYLAGLASRPGMREMQTELWDVIRKYMHDFDVKADIIPDNPTQHQETGTTRLPEAGINLQEFGGWLDTYQALFPQHLMRGLHKIDIGWVTQPQQYKGKTWHTTGWLTKDRSTMHLNVAAQQALIKEAAKKRLSSRAHIKTVFLNQLDDTLLHELAHLAHNNAPIDWLRRWQESDPITALRTLTDYTDKASDEQTAESPEQEILAEAVVRYYNNPIDLLQRSPDSFSLIDELLDGFGNRLYVAQVVAAQKAGQLSSAHYPVLGESLMRMQRTTHDQRLAALNRPRVTLHNRPVTRDRFKIPTIPTQRSVV